MNNMVDVWGRRQNFVQRIGLYINKGNVRINGPMFDSENPPVGGGFRS